MDHDDAMVGTIISRREALSLAGRAGLGLTFAGALFRGAEAASQAQAHREVKMVVAPGLTEGPFFVDERLNRSDLVAGTTRAAVAQALPLALTIKVYRLANSKYTPLEGAMFDLWCADAAGTYSDEPRGINPEKTIGEHWLRGYQLTDKDGVVKFNTIVPSWYISRTPHIHFKIRPDGLKPSSTKEFTSQFFFHDEVVNRLFQSQPYAPRTDAPTNREDNVYSEQMSDGTLAGDHMILDLKPAANGKGFSADFSIAVTDSSFHAHRQLGGPGGPGGPPPPPDWFGGF